VIAAVDGAFHEHNRQREEEDDIPIRYWKRPLEIGWDLITDEYLYPMGGFGISGTQVLVCSFGCHCNAVLITRSVSFCWSQVYLKKNLAYTPFHHELAYASAVNLNRHDSVGTFAAAACYAAASYSCIVLPLQRCGVVDWVLLGGCHEAVHQIESTCNDGTFARLTCAACRQTSAHFRSCPCA
jgi:hypothetical protein